MLEMSAGHPPAALVWYDRGVTRPATILFLGANPSGTTRLALDREVREIGERLRGSQHRDAFRIQQEWAVRATDLRNACSVTVRRSSTSAATAAA